MSGHYAELKRLDGIAASLERDGGSVSVCAELLPQMTARICPDGVPLSLSFNREDGVDVGIYRKGGIRCVLEYTDKVEVMEKYLEIEPEVLWVYPDLSNFNNVYSNVTWLVN